MVMSKMSPLNTIIIKVNKRFESTPSQLCIEVEPKNQAKRSLFGFGKPVPYYYKINNNASGEPPASARSNSLLLPGDDGENQVSFVIAYLAWCPVGNEDKCGKALGEYGDPVKVLNAMINATVQPLLWSRKDDFFSKFAEVKADVERSVNKAIKEQTGLEFDGRVKILGEENLVDIQFDEHVQVDFADSPDSGSIHVQAYLEVPEDLKILGVMALDRVESLRSLVISEIERYFRKNVKAQTYAENFQKSIEEVTEENTIEGNKESSGESSEEGGKEIEETSNPTKLLQVYLDARLARLGRRTVNLSLRVSNLSDLPLKGFVRKLVANVERLGSRAPITIESLVNLKLNDLAKVNHAHSSGFDDDWLSEEFQEIVNNVCLGKSYLDFLKDDEWKEIRASIEHRTKVKIKQTGYDVHQITSQPQLPEMVFKSLEMHSYELDDLRLNSSDQQLGKLMVHATFSLKDWNNPNLTDLVEQGVDLEREVKRLIHSTASENLIKTSPTEFFLQFSKSQEGKASIETTLKDAIKKKLADSLGANVSEITIQQIDNEKTVQIRDLMHTPNSLSFDLISYAGHEKLDCTINWQITGLNDTAWDLYTKEQFNASTIGKAITDSLISNLNTRNETLLKFLDQDGKVKIEAYCNSEIRFNIARAFGVIVTFSDLVRKKTDTEDAFSTHEMEILRTAIEARDHQLTSDLQRQKQLIDASVSSQQQQIEMMNQLQKEYDSLNRMSELTAQETKRKQILEKALSDNTSKILETIGKARILPPPGQEITARNFTNKISGGTDNFDPIVPKDANRELDGLEPADGLSGEKS